MTTRDFAAVIGGARSDAMVDLGDNAALILADPPDELTPAQFDVTYAVDLLAHLRDVIDSAPDVHTLHRATAISAAVRVLLGQVRQGKALVNAAAATTLTAERRLGLTLDHLERAPGRNQGHSPYKDTLAELGAEARTARHWRQIARIPDDVFRSYVNPAFASLHDEQQADNEIVSRSGLARYHKLHGDTNTAVSPIVNMEALQHAAAAALGGIDFAPSPGSAASQWSGRLWLAPHERDVQAWTDACVVGWTEERIEAAVVLVPLRPGASWWSTLGGWPLCLLRPHAVGGHGQTAGAVFGVAVDAQRLDEAFSSLGWVYRTP